MRTREEFGQYVLLKKLSEDPLGESFRAARVGSQGLEQVVLLRVFNGRRVDPAKLWQRIAERGKTVQKALKSPHIGHGIDLGEVRGVPYAVYDYISGKNLENLLIQAANANSPIPVDHALLIAERLSLALSVAADTRAGDERIVHGFAVPHLVMVSNEGETRVLGFEAAPGLAEQAADLGPEISRYLAPELVASGRADRSDDVFTLGAVLFELLACQPLPTAAPEAFGGLIDGARVAYDGSPLPAEIASLLRKSLAPRGQRIADAGAWHKALTQVLADSGHTATTFNLAFFMHNLFRQEIEEESREIEQEKKTVVAPAAATLIATAPVAAAAGAASPAELRAAEAAGEARAERSKVPLLAAAAVVVLLLAGGGGWYAMKSRAAAAETKAAAQPTLPAPAAQPLVAEPQGPTPEEIQAQLAAMIDTRSDEMAAQLRDQYDQKIRELQGQLQQAQHSAAEREELAREQQRLEAERQVREAEAAAAAKKPAPPVAEPPAAKPAGGAPSDGASDGAAAERVAEAARPAKSSPPPPAVTKAPEPPAVKVGDLVGIGEVNAQAPELTRQPDVRYPPMARKLNKEADVDVRVLVDENGNVRSADLMGKKVGFGLDEAALEAARSAKYRPATKDGVRVKMYVNLRIRFDL
jgi:TonB family protein